MTGDDHAVGELSGRVNVTQALADAIVLDTDGVEHPLGSLWAERVAVLIFLRHFG